MQVIYGHNPIYKWNMEFDNKKNSFGSLNQARGCNQARVCTKKFGDKPCTILQKTVPKPFRFRTKERSELRASNADRRSKQVEGKIQSQVIKEPLRSSKMVGSCTEKKTNASVSMDAVPWATKGSQVIEILTSSSETVDSHMEKENNACVLIDAKIPSATRESQVLEKLSSSRETVGSHVDKESKTIVSMDVRPLATRILTNPPFASKLEESDIPELESKIQTLETELTTLSAQLILFQRDKMSEINELRLRLQNMEQLVHLQRTEFFALHDALCERIQHLELVTGQAIPTNQKCAQLCLDVSSNNKSQQVAADANPLSSATLVGSDSQERTSIDPLNFILLESFGGIWLTEKSPTDFEFIMDSAINCSFDGSHVPEAWNRITPAGVSIDGGSNPTPISSNEGDKGTSLSFETLESSTKRMRNSCPISWTPIASSAAAAKDGFVLYGAHGNVLPSSLSSLETSKEENPIKSEEGNESREKEDLGYWEKCCVIDRMDQCSIRTDRFDPSDEYKESRVQEDNAYWLPIDGMVISYLQDETNESSEEHGGYCEPLDKVNESYQEKEDKRYYLESRYTRDPSLEFLFKVDRIPWEKGAIEAFLAEPGLSDQYMIGLCKQMLGRIATNPTVTDPHKLFNEEEVAFFDNVINVHNLNQLFPHLKFYYSPL